MESQPDTNGRDTDPETGPIVKAPKGRRKTGTPRRPTRKADGFRGVKILEADRRNGKPYARIRYWDPDGAKYRYERIPADRATHRELREDFARGKRAELDRRLGDISAGATPFMLGDTPLAAAFERYHDGWGAQRADSTQERYKRVAARFLTWCGGPGIGIKVTGQINARALDAYAQTVFKAPHAEHGGKRTTITCNNELRRLGAMLSKLRKMGLINLKKTELADGLERQPESFKKREFHRAAELRAILAACRVHDVDPYRGAFSGRMFPVVLFIILTGLRTDEAIDAEWPDVFTDDNGCIQLRIRAEVSKTGRERIIDTEHSPLLAWLLSDYVGRTGRILGGSLHSLATARHKVIDVYDAPYFQFQRTRCSTATYLTCAKAIFGGASRMSADQLGHSERVATKHYVGVVKVPSDAKTTETAMQLATDADEFGSKDQPVGVFAKVPKL